eukprot:g3468.t1
MASPDAKRRKLSSLEDENQRLRDEIKRLKTKLNETTALTTEKELNDPSRVTFRYRPPTDCPKMKNPPSSTDPILQKDAVLDAVYGKKVKGTAVVDYDYLKDFMKDTFVAYGCPEGDASISADVLIASDKRGIDSHGIGRLKPIYCERMDVGILKADSKLTFISQTATTAVVDGAGGIGLSIGPKCMALAISKAKASGIGMVCVRNSTHYGFAGYYGLMAAEQNCIGITGTNARPSIAPTYGVAPMMGTNPLVFGLPSNDPFPFVLDCATSVNQRGKIEKYAREGKSTPPGAVISADGKEVTDSNEILRLLVEKKCAMTPLGGSGHKMAGYKGYGYSSTVEILSAALQGNGWGGSLADKYVDETTGETKRRPSLLGHFFIAIDVSAFRDPADFKRDVSAILRGFRESKKDPNYGGRIYTAGEPEHVAWAHRSNHGGTPVPPALQKQMVELRNAFPAVLRKKYAKLPFE